MLKKITYIALALLTAALVAGGGAYFWLVVFQPGSEIEQENIEQILARESPVYYADETSVIGVFFRDAHRRYIPYDEIPRDFINAIVAAEDHDFFRHFGIDLPGILRALVTNIRAGRIVQGGSTITQQTAKNLFKRKDRSLRSKLKELLYALRLEYHYPKEKILEFYANQFFVSGNGHGLGVAARYYFDKPVSELSLLECAFIAGSVKRPNYYNPFTKKNPDTVSLAKMRAEERAEYVLGQMHQLAMIDAETYQTELDRRIGFTQGRMFYPLNTLMDLVRDGLEAGEVETALAEYGIENIATSGIRIYTTVEKPLQDRAMFALRKELSRLAVRLNGYDREELQNTYRDHPYLDDRQIRPRAFLFGRITGITREPEPELLVELGRTGSRPLGSGRIDRQGLQQVLTALTKWRRQRWSTPSAADLADLLNRLEVGDLVYVSVREVDDANNRLLLNLEKYPEIQGALLTIQNGTIRAMVGGRENHYFNRAVAARRPMGSVMKPLVYAAALQLGWNSLDELHNRRDVFVFQNQPYFPRPDHESPHDVVSMNWAGVKSENVATVWLLYHLCDHLNPAQFKELIANLGLDRLPTESRAGYRQRLRDRQGIIVDRESLNRIAYRRAVTEIEPDLLFTGKIDEFEVLKNLHYGAGFGEFAEQTALLREDPDYETSTRVRREVEHEIRARKRILRNNFLRLRALREELAARSDGGDVKDPFSGNAYVHEQTGTTVYSGSPPAGDHWHSLPDSSLAGLLRQSRHKDILIDGKLSVRTIDQLRSALKRHHAELATLPPYSYEILSELTDFRVLAGLRYLTSLGRALDIESELEPVLSFPLGSNVISLLETACMYEGLSTGFITTSGGGHDSLSIIARIEDPDGDLIYQPTRTKKRIFDPKTVLAVDNILRNVISHGTGKYAEDNVRLRSRDPGTASQLELLDLPLPLLGKTGTANRFINSAFAGAVPAPEQGGNGFSVENGYILAAYVGFDDNTPMVRGTTHITGSKGALPVWSRMADGVVLEKDYAGKLDLVDLAFLVDPLTGRPHLRLNFPDLGQIRVPVDAGDGLPASGPAEGGTPSSAVTFGSLKSSGELELERHFLPYWRYHSVR